MVVTVMTLSVLVFALAVVEVVNHGAGSPLLGVQARGKGSRLSTYVMLFMGNWIHCLYYFRDLAVFHLGWGGGGAITLSRIFSLKIVLCTYASQLMSRPAPLASFPAFYTSSI